ncbi:hypothetical protein [Massilia rubra]|uniref:Lipoprotein n=1 Tax=Massilia rubra TaxID=2607910 RepID=A0ABX0LHH2_9BURK|nr:hypothetical protein [Massilia rubra]NHZ34139.1 hypothetical protein [Massilia rubra]
MNNMLFSIAALLLLAGCSNNVNFSIDNPTDAAIKLQIDQTDYEIPANQSKEITLKAGEHSMDAPVAGKIKFIVYAERKGGLINPMLSDYVIVSVAYVTGEEKLKNFRPGGGGPFKLDGVPFSGPFKLVNGLFIENDWRFGVREPFPTSLQGYDPGGGGNIYSKLFTAADFVRYFESESEQAGFFEKHRQHIVSVPRMPAAPAPLPDFADPQLQSASLKLRQLYQRYQQAGTPDEQKQLQSERHKLTMEFVSLSARRLGTSPAQENDKYNKFITLIGTVLGSSALVKAP